MNGHASSLLLERILRELPRRYRLPALPALSSVTKDMPLRSDPDSSFVREPATAPGAFQRQTSPSTAIALAIEHARRSAAEDGKPDPALKPVFIDALAALIHEAMREKGGDPAFQAMVLRQRAVPVREYASLAAHIHQDERRVHELVNAIAHPAKLRRLPPGRQRDALTELHDSAAAASWSAVSGIAHHLLAMPDTAAESPIGRSLAQLLAGPSLNRLLRLDTLKTDEQVRKYQILWDRQGPRARSRTAAVQGAASRRRGIAVETLATQGLEALARRLNEAWEGGPPYRVVTSMRVPASLPASPDRAKTEWDAVLLKQAACAGAATVWDVCLLVEAKASVDAASTDLPRLLRGLRLLAHAEEGRAYSFETRQGAISLRGASLRALPTDEASLAGSVLYCCDAPADAVPRLLGAASRMQLLSATESLEFAAALVETRHADRRMLEPVWQRLLGSPPWRAVLHQYPLLRQARELMVHAGDLMASLR